jgi:thioredoxin
MKNEMKNTFIGILLLSIVWLTACSGAAKPDKTPDTAPDISNITETIPTGISENETTVVQMTKAMFLEKVYNYEQNPKKWIFIGDKPCIIDFYADWCRPCKMVAPIMAEMAEKYKGQIVVYKVNTDQERELAQFFGIRSIPTLFFCPAKGDPQMTQGALDKETYEKIITEVLLNKK